eukprot:TRINITY_DN1204_c1_g2_i1.p2 TRINITY_DN1204_c1_g2~~TRINITY_DN1204_c1_g2_i1.p2  ORF type:complete len:54 (+),score=1.70 TRINITY_DN1204_c1_g2_i1:174-335(+)
MINNKIVRVLCYVVCFVSERERVCVCVCVGVFCFVLFCFQVLRLFTLSDVTLP